MTKKYFAKYLVMQQIKKLLKKIKILPMAAFVSGSAVSVKKNV